MSDMHVALAVLAPVVFGSTGLVAFLLVCQSFGLDLMVYLGKVALRFRSRGKSGVGCAEVNGTESSISN